MFWAASLTSPTSWTFYAKSAQDTGYTIKVVWWPRGGDPDAPKEERSHNPSAVCILHLDKTDDPQCSYAQKLSLMRTTLDLPEDLIAEAMKLTKIATKTDLIKTALANLITRERIKNLKFFYGKIDLDANLDILRKR